jgi:hypothetical protein
MGIYIFSMVSHEYIVRDKWNEHNGKNLTGYRNEMKCNVWSEWNQSFSTTTKLYSVFRLL